MSSQSEKSISSCPYNKCDGSGMFLIDDDNAKICQCQHDKIIDRKLEFANIPKEFQDLTIKSFEIDIYTRPDSKTIATIAKKVAANFVKNFEEFQDEGKGLYMYSTEAGSGKTRMAISIGNALIKVKRVQVKYTKTVDLLNEITDTFNSNSEMSQKELIDSIRKVEVLILDDVGVENPTPWVKSTFYSILDSRMDNKKVTIFTSNLSLDELKHDRRLKSRIERMATPVKFPEESIRNNLARQENERLQRLLLE